MFKCEGQLMDDPTAAFLHIINTDVQVHKMCVVKPTTVDELRCTCMYALISVSRINYLNWIDLCSL